MIKIAFAAILSFFVPLKKIIKISGVTNFETYTVSGKLSSYDTGWVYLYHSDKLKRGTRLDSAKVINGLFNFSGDVSGIEAVLFGFRNKDKKGILLPSITYKGVVILSKGDLYIEGKYNSGDPLIATGTIAQHEYNAFTDKVGPLNKKLIKIINDRYAVKKTESSKLDSLNTTYILVTKEIKEIVKKHITNFPNSLVSAYIAQTELLNSDFNTLKFIYTSLSEGVKASTYGKELDKLIQNTEATGLGKIAPEFNLPSSTGQIVSLKNNLSKFTLIDFWASWCGPCRQENPNLLKAYKKYQSSGFNIISISMDVNKQKWFTALKEDKLPWLQLSDLKGLKSITGQNYGIKLIPMNFLVDMEGRIIAKNLMGSELTEELEKLLK